MDTNTFDIDFRRLSGKSQELWSFKIRIIYKKIQGNSDDQHEKEYTEWKQIGGPVWWCLFL